MKTRKIIITLSLLLIFAGCKKEDSTPETRYVSITVKSAKSASIVGSAAIAIKYTGADGIKSLSYAIQTSGGKSDSLVVAKDMVAGTALEISSTTLNGYSVLIIIKSAEKLGNALYSNSAINATNKITTYSVNMSNPYITQTNQTGL